MRSFSSDSRIRRWTDEVMLSKASPKALIWSFEGTLIRYEKSPFFTCSVA